MSAGSMRDWGKKLKWMFIMINVNQTKKKKNQDIQFTQFKNAEDTQDILKGVSFKNFSAL